MHQNSSVTEVTGRRIDGSFFPAGIRFFSEHHRRDWTWVPLTTVPYPLGTKGSFSESKVVSVKVSTTSMTTLRMRILYIQSSDTLLWRNTRRRISGYPNWRSNSWPVTGESFRRRPGSARVCRANDDNDGGVLAEDLNNYPVCTYEIYVSLVVCVCLNTYSN
jgi:hypothetical protein